MDLRGSHHGYTYQDLLTAVRLVDVLLGTATTVLVDTKEREGDRFLIFRESLVASEFLLSLWHIQLAPPGSDVCG